MINSPSRLVSKHEAGRVSIKAADGVEWALNPHFRLSLKFLFRKMKNAFNLVNANVIRFFFLRRRDTGPIKLEGSFFSLSLVCQLKAETQFFLLRSLFFCTSRVGKMKSRLELEKRGFSNHRSDHRFDFKVFNSIRDHNRIKIKFSSPFCQQG